MFHPAACQLVFSHAPPRGALRWHAPSPTLAAPALPPGQVHLWRARLDLHEDHANAARRFLCIDEQQRADRYRFARDRHRFTLARALLRWVLAGYVGAPAEQLRFAYGPYGKPALGDPDTTRLQFNLSHAGDLWLLAVAHATAVGVDVEPISAGVDLEAMGVMSWSCDPAHLSHLSPAQRQRALLQRWTAREAQLKALGTGWALEPAPACAPTFPRPPAPAPTCRAVTFEPLPGYLAGLALAG